MKILLWLTNVVLAAEGMWPPSLLQSQEKILQQAGLKLSVDQLQHQHQPILGSIHKLGPCTAVLLSANGLLLTNYHCIIEQLVNLSATQPRILKSGFIAPTHNEELWLGTDLQLHYLQTNLTDIRLVYAPSYSNAMFGESSNNWKWPRYSADFVLLRAYIGPSHHQDNHPLTAKYHLSIAHNTGNKNDFVMAIGYPSQTHRHKTYAEMKQALQHTYPQEQKLLQRWIQILDQRLVEKTNERQQILPLLSQLKNQLEFGKGIVQNASQNLQRKRGQELHFLQWLKNHPKQQLYEQAYFEQQSLWSTLFQLERQQKYLYRLKQSSILLTDVMSLWRWSQQPASKPLIQKRQQLLHHSTSPIHIDKALLTILLKETTKADSPTIWTWLKQYKSPNQAIQALFQTSELHKRHPYSTWVTLSYQDLLAKQDPWLILAKRVTAWESQLVKNLQKLNKRREKNSRLLAEAYQQFTHQAPDADGSLRISYGHILDHSDCPRNSSLHQPRNMTQPKRKSPTNVPSCNFLSTSDITLGHSGAATLNAHGHLIGLVFDGQHQALPNQWIFTPGTSRGVHLNIHYVLALLQQHPESRYLLKELTFP